MEIPEDLRLAVVAAVTHSLTSELDARGLLLTTAASDSAAVDSLRTGDALLDRLVTHWYPDSADGAGATAVDFDDDQAAMHVELALAFGSITATLLTPLSDPHRNQPVGSVDLLCAVFNLGIGLVDGLCDLAPHIGLRVLQILESLDLPGAAREMWAPGRLRAALPTSLAADPTVAFTARVIETFFDLLHAAYPGNDGSALRRHVAADLEAALEAERQSVDHAAALLAWDQLVECSRQTSVLPFQVIEHLATGDHALASPSAGTLLGEAMWRIDDLVDLTQDAGLDALNSVLMAAVQGPGRANADQSVVVVLDQVLGSQAIPAAAAQAVERLDAGLTAAARGPATAYDGRLFLSFVQRYAGIAPIGD